MNLPELALKRPIAISMLFAAAIMVGVISLSQMPVELYPNVSFGEISIIIQIRGGIPPTEVETLVTKPVEEAVSTVSNLKNVISSSKEGESWIWMEFDPGTDMDFAALEVREKFAQVKNKLPKEIEKPIIAQFKRSDVPIVIVAVTSDRRTPEQLRKIVDEDIKERIMRIGGVANVEVSGGRERKILVEVDQRRLAAYGVSLEQIISMLSLNNLNLLSGDVEKRTKKYIVRAIGEFESVEDIKNLGIHSSPKGEILRLKDVADVKDSYLEPKSHSRLNIRPVVSLYIQKETTENTIRVAKSVVKEVGNIQENILPSDIRMIITSNQATFIESSINNLTDSLLKGAIMIVLVLLMFLKGLRSKYLIFIISGLIAAIFLPRFVLYIALLALISWVCFSKGLRSVLVVASSIPVSVMITFGFLKAQGLSINFITLFGLALGVGMLVDNSVVVFENILKLNEKGSFSKDSTVESTNEVLLAIIASTVTTIIVFLPMVFMSQEIKLLYSGIAWTVTYALGVSLFVALTIVPMMSYFLNKGTFSKKPVSEKDNESASKGKGDMLSQLYLMQKKGISFTLRYRYIVLAALIVLFGFLIFFFTKLGMEFIGTTEQNKFIVFIELPTGAKLEESDKVVAQVEKLLENVPEVKTFSARVEPWSSKVYVELVGITERTRSVAEVIDSLRPHTDRLQPAFIYYDEPQEVGTKEIILDLYGYDYDILREMAISIATRLGTVRGLSDIKIRMREGRPELGIKVDKKMAAKTGLTVGDIATMLHARMRGLRATLFHSEQKEVETIARLDERHRRTFKDLHKMLLTTPDGKKIFLDSVSDFEYGLGPSEIWRKNKNRMVQVSANIGDIALSKAAEKIDEAISDIKFQEGYFYRFGGNYPMMVSTRRQFRAIIWLVIALVYIVLASLFESYKQPFIIMFSLPLALIGAILVLYVFNISVGMGVLIGLMMLSGIVVNNSIIMVDRANSLREGYKNIMRVIFYAARDRLRPVLMTSITTILGLLPMALDKSEGSNLWAPLAMTVIGGLTVSTMLTLTIIPCIYIIFEEFKTRKDVSS
jgi:HAE1 family hydrophobic/amphiphilic exporter-1